MLLRVCGLSWFDSISASLLKACMPYTFNKLIRVCLHCLIRNKRYICSDDCGNPKGHNKAVEEIAILLYIDESIC